MDVTNFAVRWCNGRYIFSMGVGETIELNDLYFYYKVGKVTYEFQITDCISFWGTLNGKYELNKRLKINLDKNEVFAIRNKGGWNKHTYDVYIPAEAINLIPHGHKVKKTKEYEYTYEIFSFNGSNLKYPPYYDGRDRCAYMLSENTIGFEVFKESKKTKFKREFDSLVEDIEKTCEINVDTWKLGRILEHYNIIKK